MAKSAHYIETPTEEYDGSRVFRGIKNCIIIEALAVIGFAAFLHWFWK